MDGKRASSKSHSIALDLYVQYWLAGKAIIIDGLWRSRLSRHTYLCNLKCQAAASATSKGNASFKGQHCLICAGQKMQLAVRDMHDLPR